MDAVLRKTWERLGIDPAELELEADGTLHAEAKAPTRPSDDLRRSRDATLAADAEAIAQPLPRLSSEQVEIGPLLGEGGMGRVWLAEQRSLRRQVAVKGVREAVDGPLARMQLLREARVTGRLEHPNVVPVHVLVRDASGAPRMVMKRIDGRGWHELLQEDRDAEGRLREEALEAHLRILAQVCHAVHYAHARGVLHRDLKPENVMVGEYGEVYLVDWGIAVALPHAEDLEELPLATDVRGIVGTLPYMAPEMVAGDGRALGVHSDVYLLGSVLHEVLAGTLRHQGDSLPQLVHAAWVSEAPELGEAVPEELAALVIRATAKEPSDRPESAEEFRRALEAFLTHRNAAVLAAEGAERYAEACEAEGEEALRLLQEARMAYRQALRIWSESTAALEGLRAVLGYWIERALAERDVGTARMVLAEMEADEQARWREEVEEVARAIEGRDRKLAALEAAAQAADMGVAARKRRGFGIGFAVAFLVLNGVLDQVERAGDLGHMGYLFWTGAMAAVIGLPVAAMHRTLFPNDASLRLGWGLALLLFGQVGTFLGLTFLNVPLRPSLAVTLLSLGSIIAVKSASLDWRMMWSAVLSVALGVVALWRPEIVFYAVGIAYGSFFAGGAMLTYEEAESAGS